MTNNKPSKEILNKMMVIAESIFGTEKDLDQISVTMDSWNKFQAVSENCVLYEQDNDGNLTSWVVVLPTSAKLMEKFINKKITEQQLLDQTKVQQKYSALYLCSAITISKYRRKGRALKLLKEAITKLSTDNNLKLFAWPTTREGESMVKKLSRELGREILIRE